jgi:aspartate/methionine/tyrosine aminotransferase
LQKGFTHYSPPAGREELREAIAVKLKKENKISADPEDIIVTVGSTEGILLTLLSIVDPGEFVMVPDPGFIVYIPMVEMLNGYPVSIPMYEKDDWQFDPDNIKKEFTEPKKVKAIILNTPANPTGAVYTRNVLEEIADIVVDEKILVISDEAYEKFVYSGKHISIGSLNGMHEYVMTLNTFSKTYGMAGFRVGYATGPRKIIEAMNSLHVYTSISPSTPCQMAAVAALKGPQNSIKKIVSEFKKRRDLITKRINEVPKLQCIEPQGAFYVFARYDLKMDSTKLAETMLEKAKVAVIPGHDFGRYGEGYIRFSFATSRKNIEQGMDRVEKFFKNLK